MEDVNGLSWADLENALNSEIAELNSWGWDTETTEEVNAEANTDTEETTEETETDNIEDEHLSKSEKKIKKLLSQRNEEKDKNTDLENRIKELEKTNTDSKFYTDNPWAEQHKEAIEAEMIETPWISMEKAFKIVATWDIIEANKTASAWNRWIVWKTPWTITDWKAPKDMSKADLDAQVREMYKSWKISI